MAEWTPEAREYLDGYLGQVSALARHQGDDAEEIVVELREHIQREAEGAGGPLVTVDQLRAVLAAIGTPDQIAGVESALEGPEEEAPSLRETVERLRGRAQDNGSSPAAPPPVAPQVIVEQPKRSNLGCWIAAVPVGCIMLYLAIPLVGILAAILLPAVARSRMTGREARAEEAVRAIARAQERFQEACYVDADGNGVGDYGTLTQLAEPAEGVEPLIDRYVASGSVHDYGFTVKVTLGEPGREPGYECVATPNVYGESGRRSFLIDQSGVIRHTANGAVPTVHSPTLDQPPTAEWAPVDADRQGSGPRAVTAEPGPPGVAPSATGEINQYKDPT